MTLHIHNSLTRQKEEFTPLNPPEVLFYNCGPTVYGEFHVGNARNFVVFDMIHRWLIACGYKVNYVQNITDVDDKIINRAAEEGIAPEVLAEKYTRYFLKKLDQLGNLPATSHPRATQNIGGIISLIETLVHKGHAYPTDDGSVWFEVGTFQEYGKLSRMPLDQMQQGERLDEAQQSMKKSPTDFCLWKASKPGEPAWESPWGKGRPGWHIECSCMAMRTLRSETIDIHGGGVDLRFPHHENEIAQSEAATGKPFARYWIHNGMLDIEGEKMSKSLGNIKTIDDLLAIIDGLTLRYFLLSARYRDKLDFSGDNIQKCKSAVERIITANRESRRVLQGMTVDENWNKEAELKDIHDEFCEAMNDDFHTPRALAAISRAVTLLNTVRTEVESGGNVLRLSRCAALLHTLRDYLGIGEDMEQAEDDFDPQTFLHLHTLWIRSTPAPMREANPESGAEVIEELIRVRKQARKEKNFSLADQIRDELARLGVVLEDKPGETLWRRVR